MNATAQHAGFLDLPLSMTPAPCVFCGHRAKGSVRGREITFCRFSGERLKSASVSYGCEGFHVHTAETSTKAIA